MLIGNCQTKISENNYTTEELFKYSVIISENEEYHTEEVTVNSVLEDSIMGYYAALCERGIEPSVRITEKPIVRSLNRADLARVFANLIGNALKYSDGDLSISLDDDGVILFSNTASSLDVNFLTISIFR